MHPALPYCYEYPRPAVSADCVVLGMDSGTLKILLIERKNEPFKGKWALPGGFMNIDENAEECAKRELFEETGLKIIDIEQLYTATDVHRDPRGRVITIAYLVFVKPELHILQAGDDAGNVKWFPVSAIPPLAFDHRMIVDMGLRKIDLKLLKP